MHADAADRFQDAFACLDKPVSPICLGTASMGSEIAQDDAFSLLDGFVELGGNVLDTAHVYGAWAKHGVNGGVGNSEVVIGRWMRRSDNRARIVVGTKGGHPDFDTGESGLTPEALSRQLRESLDRLQTDYVDIYWLHRDDRSIPVPEILGMLKEATDAGAIRALACSHWRADRLDEAARAAREDGLPPLRASQISWCLAADATPVDDGPFGEQLAMDDEMWDWHGASGMPVAAYNAQGGGFFAAKYDGLDFHADGFPNPGLAHKYGSDANLRRRALARRLAGSKGCSANQVAVAYLRHQPFPVLPIVGPHSREQLEDSLAAASVDLNEAEVEMLRRGDE